MWLYSLILCSSNLFGKLIYLFFFTQTLFYTVFISFLSLKSAHPQIGTCLIGMKSLKDGTQNKKRKLKKYENSLYL